MTEEEMIDALNKTTNVEIDDSTLVKAYDDVTEAMKSFNEKFGKDFSKKQQKLIRRTFFCRNLQLIVLAGMFLTSIIDIIIDKHLVIVNLVMLFTIITLCWCMTLFERSYWKNSTDEKSAYVDFLFKEFYCDLITTERKCRTFKKVYEDTYVVMNKIPTAELEAAKKETGVDFSYLQKEIEFLENIAKKENA